MGKEIERKFLVRGGAWKQEAEGTQYRQGYLTTDAERTVRVRVVGERGYLTIKGKTEGIERAEFEYPIPGEEAAQMLDRLCLRPLIEKVRYRVDYAGQTWEVDEFSGENEGLVLAEIELTDPDQTVELPEWVAEDVSDDPRYYNANLVAHPYSKW